MSSPGLAGVPRFRRDLRAEIGGSGVFLFGEHGVTALRGAPVAALAALLDGKHDTEALLAARPGRMDAAQIEMLLTGLVDAGLVRLDPPSPASDEPALAWWEGCGVDGAALAAAGTVAVTAMAGSVGPGPLRTALEGAGFPVELLDVDALERDGTAAELAVVLCSDYLDPALGRVDAAHRAAGRPWLLAKPDGGRVWIGPVFRPGGACWNCLATRLWTHRHAEAVVQRSLGHEGPAPRPLASVPAVASAGAHLVALEVGKWAAGHRYPGQDSVWIFDTHELTGERHELRARPQCAACGDPGMVAENALRPVRLRPAPKAAGVGGGDRVLGPAETLARYRHLVSPVTGIVKRVVRDPAAPPFVHAFRSGANVSRQVTGLDAVRGALRAENGGKGLTALDAEVGALCEAAERFSGTWQGDELRVRGSLRTLGHRAVDPRTCQLVDERQYADRDSWNPRHSPFNRVPAPFDPAADIDWTPLWSLTEHRHRLLPTGMLYFDAPHVPSLHADSNGCAAGTSVEDAVLQGLFELVERDAVGIWWHNRLFVPEVDLDGFGDARIAEQGGHHAGIGRELRMLDVTSDLGIPTMAAVSRRVDGGEERLLLGFGAHLDPATAVRRAVSEVNQMLPSDAIAPAALADPDWSRWAAHATLANQPYLRPDRAVRPRRLEDYLHVRRPDVRDDVEAVVDLLAERGLETLVLDQTRPDVGLPVVRVVVPGLRTFWSRYAPGRLFDVPVGTGVLSRPTAYAELNPQPLFM